MPERRRPLFEFEPPKLSRATDPREREAMLLFEDAEFREHMVGALNEVKQNAAIRRDFTRDPVGTTVRTFMPVHWHHLADRELSNANKLVMSAVSNEGFRGWMDGYQRRLAKEHTNNDEALRSIVEDKNRILQDLAQALLEHGDATLIKNFLVASSSSGRVSVDDLNESRETLIPVRRPDILPEPPERPGVVRPDPTREVGLFVIVVVVVVALAIAVAFVAADSDSSTVGPDMRNLGGPEFRALADQLVQRATVLDQAGLLDDIDARIQ